MQLEVINFRPYTGAGAVGFFDVAIDQTFVVRGFALKRKTDGSAYYWQSPSKARMKSGVQVKDDKGFPIYDAHFDLFGSRDKNGDYKVAPAAFEARTKLIELAVEAYSTAQAGNSGRGTAKAAKPAAVSSSVEGADDSEDDDLPF